MQLLYDLQLLAYQSDLTRVITFMYGREQTGRPYPQIGIPEPHHSLTHHQNDPVKMEKCARIQMYHVKLFADYLAKLRATPDGDGSLLDHTILLYGGGISNSDRHTHGPLPTLVAGGGAGTIQGGRHLIYPDDTPLANLQLTLLNKMSVAAETLATARDNSRNCPSYRPRYRPRLHVRLYRPSAKRIAWVKYTIPSSAIIDCQTSTIRSLVGGVEMRLRRLWHAK